MRTCAGVLGLQMPGEREVGVGDPILQVRAAPVKDLPDLACIDQLLGKSHGGGAAVVVIEVMKHTGFFGGIIHFLRLSVVERNGFFAEDRLAIFCSGDDDFLVQVGGGANIDDVHILAFDHFSPVALGFLPAPVFGKIAGVRLHPARRPP